LTPLQKIAQSKVKTYFGFIIDVVESKLPARSKNSPTKAHSSGFWTVTRYFCNWDLFSPSYLQNPMHQCMAESDQIQTWKKESGRQFVPAAPSLHFDSRSTCVQAIAKCIIPLAMASSLDSVDSEEEPRSVLMLESSPAAPRLLLVRFPLALRPRRPRCLPLLRNPFLPGSP
jgi:hypothetical protein